MQKLTRNARHKLEHDWHLSHLSTKTPQNYTFPIYFNNRISIATSMCSHLCDPSLCHSLNGGVGGWDLLRIGFRFHNPDNIFRTLKGKWFLMHSCGTSQQYLAYSWLCCTENESFVLHQQMVTKRFLSHPLICGTVFHRLSPLLHLSLCFALVLNHTSSLFPLPISDSLISCSVPAQWLVILDIIIVFTLHFLHFLPWLAFEQDAINSSMVVCMCWTLCNES